MSEKMTSSAIASVATSSRGAAVIAKWRLIALPVFFALALVVTSAVMPNRALADDESFALLADTHLGQPGYHA